MKTPRTIVSLLLAGALSLSLLSGCVSSPDSSSSGESGSSASSAPSSSSTEGVPPAAIDGDDAAISPLDMKTVSPVSVKGRATAGNTRLVVNTENPLFLFRSSYPEKADGVVKLWNMLPEDIRAYSAIMTTYDANKDNDTVMQYFDDILTVSDAQNIPVVLQIEHWNSYSEREMFTQEQLSSLLKRHVSLKGYAHTELSCMYSEEEEGKRIKNTLRACKENNALFIWFDMEYVQNTNVFARFLEDEELYSLMSSYAHNVVLVDKHNGQGRHFAVQSAAMGCWLSGVCGNWGSNVESWLWWEEGLGQYNDMGGTLRCMSDDLIKQYPSSMMGIDTLNDTVGGATVYSFEDLTITAVSADGETMWTPAFYNVLYPIYQKIVSGKLIPTRDEVKSKVKVAYQYSDIDAEDTAGFESPLLIDLYGPTLDHMNTYRQLRVSKKWLPTTGRYYIIPSLLKQVSASSVLPDAAIVNSGNYQSLLGSDAASKQAYFNGKYAETYTGTATMYAMDGYSLIFNNHENTTINAHESARFSLKNQKTMTVDLPEHSYSLLYEDGGSLKAELYNYRYDARDFLNKKIRWDMFIDDYLEGNRDTSPEDLRTTTITLEGLTARPEIVLAGNNSASSKTSWDETNGALTIQITSNGVVTLQLNGLA